VCQDLLKINKIKGYIKLEQSTATSLAKILAYLIWRRKTASRVSKFSYKLISHLMDRKKKEERHIQLNSKFQIPICVPKGYKSEALILQLYIDRRQLGYNWWNYLKVIRKRNETNLGLKTRFKSKMCKTF
jgi:hypothetical protein